MSTEIKMLRTIKRLTLRGEITSSTLREKVHMEDVVRQVKDQEDNRVIPLAKWIVAGLQRPDTM